MRPLPFLALLFLAAALPLPAQIAGDTIEKRAANDAMTPWLQEVDQGAYAQAWEESSAQLKKDANKETWIASIQALREPLGKSLNRNLASTLLKAATAPVPGTALTQVTGETVVAQHDSSFENVKYALETVTFTKDPEGVWRAVSYTVQPKSDPDAQP